MASHAAALIAKGRVGSSADAQMLVACATAALQKQAHRDAYGMLDQALTLDPENVRGWVLMGMCHEQAGRIASARDAYAMALSLDERHAACRLAQKRLALLDPG